MDKDTVGMQAARAYAQWHLGYPEWADQIIHAYEHPYETLEILRSDGMDTRNLDQR